MGCAELLHTKRIYFAASIRGGREDVELYRELIAYLQQWGRVLTEHIGDRELALRGEDNIPDHAIHRRDLT